MILEISTRMKMRYKKYNKFKAWQNALKEEINTRNMQK